MRPPDQAAYGLQLAPMLTEYEDAGRMHGPYIRHMPDQAQTVPQRDASAVLTRPAGCVVLQLRSRHPGQLRPSCGTKHAGSSDEACNSCRTCASP